MLYKIVTAAIQNDGTVVEGKRKQTIVWPTELEVGGLYFLAGGRLGSHKLYRVVEMVV